MDQLLVRTQRAALQLALTELSGCAAYVREHQERLKEQPQAGSAGREAAAVREVLSQPVPQTPAELHEFSRETQEKLKRALKAASEASAQRQAMEKAVSGSIARDIARGFGATLDQALDALAPSKEPYVRRLEAIAAEAVCLETAEQARQALSQLAAIRELALVRPFGDVTVAPLERRHRQEAAQYAQEQQEYQLLRSRHAALCAELNVPASPQPWSPGALAALKAAVMALEEKLLMQEEQRYIRKALDEVMADMGYGLLGERDVTKRSGARFHHALYTFGDGTAVDVTYDANGQVAMELGGLDERDRLPDAHESAALCRSMEEFCTSFEEVERRLADRGVVLRERIALLPPSQDYAQIINVQDYQLTGEAALLDVKQERGSDRRTQQYLERD